MPSIMYVCLGRRREGRPRVGSRGGSITPRGIRQRPPAGGRGRVYELGQTALILSSCRRLSIFFFVCVCLYLAPLGHFHYSYLARQLQAHVSCLFFVCVCLFVCLFIFLSFVCISLGLFFPLSRPCLSPHQLHTQLYSPHCCLFSSSSFLCLLIS